jgi:hypothetical protein
VRLVGFTIPLPVLDLIQDQQAMTDSGLIRSKIPLLFVSDIDPYRIATLYASLR